MDDAALRTRAWATVAEEQRLFGTHVPGARLIEGDGWVASVVPSAADSPLLNTIVPVRRGAGVTAIDRLLPEFGTMRWGVWAQRREEPALRRAGLRSELAPWRLMAAPIDDLALEAPGEGEPTDDLALVGALNDDAYGLDDGRLEQHLSPLPPDRVRGYRLDEDGRPVAALAYVQREDDAGFLFVATLPRERHRGLASALMCRALTDARAGGARTASLLATAMGRGLYDRLGFRDLGAARLWEPGRR